MIAEQKQTNDRNTAEPSDSKQEPSLVTGADKAETSTAVSAEITEQSTMEWESSASAIDTDALRQEIENLRQQMVEAKDRMLRTQAEMDNLRKRLARDVENAHKYALSKFVGELLPVLDSLELGLSNSNGPGGIESFLEGMDLTLTKFLATLEKFGVTVVDPQGDKFNPEKHEAVTMQAQEGAAPGTVLSVMQKGYELNGRLVRPAMVIVAK
ncbi:MAG: GrpE protein [Gammaproteobacteria bacterium]|nr:GrpE protein [Gammaproteobacteria bacterium]